MPRSRDTFLLPRREKLEAWIRQTDEALDSLDKRREQLLSLKEKCQKELKELSIA